MDERKACSRCGETKPLDAFYRKLGQPTSWCKACILADQRDRWRARHPAAPPYVPPTEKECHGCRQIKPIDDFHHHRRSKDGRQARCKSCQSKAVVSGYRNDPQKHADYNREWGRRNQDSRADTALKVRLGLPRGTYDRMLAEQGGRCAICGTDSPTINDTRIRRFAVDHDELTGAIRGLLCTRCNTGIGQFLHDPERLRAAIRYLATYGLSEVAGIGSGTLDTSHKLLI